MQEERGTSVPGGDFRGWREALEVRGAMPGHGGGRLARPH